MNPKKIILVRHGVTAWNQQSRFQGSSDIPLSEEGEEQALRTGDRLASWHPDAIWSSPLCREEKTAQIIAWLSGNNIEPEIHEELREMSFGYWEGLTMAEIKRRYPDEFERWRNGPFDNIPEGGESALSIEERSKRMAQKLLDSPLAKILVVAHGGTLRALLASLLSASVPDLMWKMRMENCSLSAVSVMKTRISLLYLNDTHHLRVKKEDISGITLDV